MRAPSPLAGVAGIAQRLAVLLAAGVGPMAAWRYLDHSRVVDAVVESGVDPTHVPGAIRTEVSGMPSLESAAWRGLAAAWAVATEAGAPLAPTLRDYAISLRSLAQAQRDAAVALAAPVATARLVMVLPLVGVLFGMALGFNTFGTLFATPIGWGCIVIGGGLMLLASRWNRRLVRRAQPGSATPGLECDLMAIALAGGGSLAGARTLVAATIVEYRLDSHDDLAGVLDLSSRAGVPAADLLRSEAEESRRAAAADAQERAEALSVRLMLPLGLCVLPAFVVLGVIPLLVAVISSTVGTF